MSQLDDIDFGLGAAQQERQLRHYFYRSGSFNLACSDKTYLILGGKGAGKSAIFRMFDELRNEIPIFRSPNLWISDEPQLRDHHTTLRSNNIASETTLWRFYMASLIAKHCLEQSNLPEDLRKDYNRFLVRWGLVRVERTAWQIARNLKFDVSLAGFLKTEFPPTTPYAVTEIDYVIHSANHWLDGLAADLWICLDSLDEVSLNGQGANQAEELLSSLMRAVGEVIRLGRIRFKLFFRTDIYNALTYVNKDHFSALKLELQWSKEDLAIMLAHRLHILHPGHTGRLDFPISIQWVNEVFDWQQPRLPRGFDQLYELLKDGNGDVLPRDMINFCISAQREQQNYNLQGIDPPGEGKLISSIAAQEALRKTADSKLTDFLQVYQNFKKAYDQLKGSRSRFFTRAELSSALGKKDLVEAQLVISDLVRVGALAIRDRKAVNLSDKFEVPFLYALALEIGDTHGTG